MKKLLPVITSLLIFAALFTACGNNANTPELTEEEEYTNFYNKIAAHTWVDNNVDFTFSSYDSMKVIKKLNLSEDSNIIKLYSYDNSNNLLGEAREILFKDFSNNLYRKITSNKWIDDTVSSETWTIELKSNNSLSILFNWDGDIYTMNFSY